MLGMVECQHSAV